MDLWISFQNMIIQVSVKIILWFKCSNDVGQHKKSSNCHCFLLNRSQTYFSSLWPSPTQCSTVCFDNCSAVHRQTLHSGPLNWEAVSLYSRRGAKASSPGSIYSDEWLPAISVRMRHGSMLWWNRKKQCVFQPLKRDLQKTKEKEKRKKKLNLDHKHWSTIYFKQTAVLKI